MIIKLVDRKEGAKGALRYARTLASYMADADPRRLQPDAAGLDYGLTLSAYMTRERERNAISRERVLCRGALIGGEQAGWDDGLAEMERRLARRSSRVKKPARHVVLSYRAGEQPDVQQCHDAIALLAHELGCEAAAILWAAHADTANVHIHALFVTVDPETGAALPFGQGADGRANYKEAMQRAIARIEHAQQLQPEASGRYEISEGHVVRKPAPVEQDGSPRARKRAPLRQEILAFEERSGFASFTRFAQEVAGPILDDAMSWPKLHRDLAAIGLGVRQSVNGGELYAGAEHVKLSNVDRRHSWTQLVKPDRLGPYVPPKGIELAPYEPRILDQGKAADWLGRREREQAISVQIDQRIAALFAARDATLAEMRADIAAHRNDLAGFDGDPRLHRDIAAAWPRIGADALASLGAAFDARIAAVRALRHAAAGLDDLDMVDLAAIGAVESGVSAPWHGDRTFSAATVLAGFDAEHSGYMVRYWARSDRARAGQPALVDAGAIIWVNDTSDRAVEAALTLAQARFGSAAVFGDAVYLAQCAAVAERLGIAIETITVAEARRRAQRGQPPRQVVRQRALDRHDLDRTDAVSRQRAWARAYNRATPEDYMAAPSNREATLRDVPHHSAIPTSQPEALPVSARSSDAVWQRPTPSRDSEIG
ncbi:relaxase/mobilization nuclease domain-containing protein [Sphingomonas sp.]|uniref:relaxase/mobilization nuclease domain-containing protein n=1 Tax=Sphingomonas sp. TaxID=28214 RepID=UPI003AFF63A2